MAKIKLGRSRLHSENNSGFSSSAAGRFVNKNGMRNVRRTGLANPLQHYSWYHTLLGMPSWKFISALVVLYIFINFIFAFIYYIIGIEHLTGIDKSSFINEFNDVFFFSSQTFTTVGYGRIAPVGFMASLVSTFEAFLGLLGFAIATGLFYGRFSRPRAYLRFSSIALIAPYEGGTALMLRMAPYKNNLLTDGRAIMNVAIEEEDEAGVPRMQFYPLPPVINTISNLTLNWTLVHRIDEDSPLYGLTEENFKTSNIEVIVQIRAFDEVFSNTVVQRTSYSAQHGEIRYGAKFNMMYKASDDKKTTILNLGLIDDYTPVALP